LKNAIIQIHDIETQNLVQSIALATLKTPISMSLISYPIDLCLKPTKLDEKSDNNDFRKIGIVQALILTENDIFGLLMAPLEIQLEQLFKENKIDEGARLLNKMDPNQYPESFVSFFLI
jgi:hypothetical protein